MAKKQCPGSPSRADNFLQHERKSSSMFDAPLIAACLSESLISELSAQPSYCRKFKRTDTNDSSKSTKQVAQNLEKSFIMPLSASSMIL